MQIGRIGNEIHQRCFAILGRTSRKGWSLFIPSFVPLYSFFWSSLQPGLVFSLPPILLFYSVRVLGENLSISSIFYVARKKMYVPTLSCTFCFVLFSRSDAWLLLSSLHFSIFDLEICSYRTICDRYEKSITNYSPEIKKLNNYKLFYV